MSALFEELGYQATPIGALSLRRRRDLRLGVDVFEIKLGEDYLMSSQFTASEIALARLGLAELSRRNLDVVVGGLGLGYTAAAVLEHPQVGSLLVIDALAAVIDWHRKGLVPLGAARVAIQMTWRAPPRAPLARAKTSSTPKPALRSRRVKSGSGPDDHTASTPPGRNAAWAARNPLRS